MDVFPDFGGVGGAADLRAIVGALLMFVLVTAVLMLIVCAIIWAIASSSGNYQAATKARTGLFVAVGAAALAGAGVLLAGAGLTACSSGGGGSDAAGSTAAGPATVTVTQYVDRERVIRLKGEIIIKEVPRYVPIQADAACVVPRGFVRLHDAAAAGAVPDPDTGDADAAASGVALSAVAATVAANYTDSHANSEQLKALQETLRDQGVTIIGEASAP